jgi:hypothetical protein
MTRFLGLCCLVTAVVAFGACDSPLAPPPPPPPPPPPVPTRYQLSGFVTAETGLPVANHQVAVEAFFSGERQATTSTNVDGYYEMTLDTPPGSPFPSFVHAGGGEYDHHYVQAVVDIVQNLRLRRIRTVEAGQSIVISIDRDSSLAVDGGDWWMQDHVWEKVHVRVAEAGILTVDARPEAGGIVPSRMVIVNCDVNNRCSIDWVTDSAIASRSVKENSLVEIRVAIPSARAPQRYEVATSVQR